MAIIGINVTLPAPVDQATIINQAIGSQVELVPLAQLPR